jgi:hypothetical protein
MHERKISSRINAISYLKKTMLEKGLDDAEIIAAQLTATNDNT